MGFVYFITREFAISFCARSRNEKQKVTRHFSLIGQSSAEFEIWCVGLASVQASVQVVGTFLKVKFKMVKLIVKFDDVFVIMYETASALDFFFCVCI